MDKTQRKILTQKYKKAELEDLAKSDESILANYAKRKLGQFDTNIFSEKIISISDSNLIEAVVNNIYNKVEQTFIKNPKKNISRGHVFNSLIKSNKYIYSIYEFESQVKIGDIEKYFESASFNDKELLMEAYLFFNQDLIVKSIQTEDIKNLVLLITTIKDSSEKILIDYIRTNMNEFE